MEKRNLALPLCSLIKNMTLAELIILVPLQKLHEAWFIHFNYFISKVFVWIGKGANIIERKESFRTAVVIYYCLLGFTFAPLL